MTTANDWVSLDPGEEIIWMGGPRMRRILSDVVMFLFWSLAALVAVFALTSVLTVELPVPDSTAWAIAGLWILLQAAGPVKAYLRTTNTAYLLTDENLYKKTGVWSENVTRIGIGKIQNTSLRKDFFGNVFDYGTILVSTAGSGGAEMVLSDLDDPDVFRTELRARMTEVGNRDRPAPEHGHSAVDPETVRALVDEARKLRESAENIERHFQ